MGRCAALHSHTVDMRELLIDACLSCYQTGVGMASNHCLEVGGEHVELEHHRLMLSSATCRTCAYLMLIGSPVHKHQCGACAAVCAASYEVVGDMDACVKACRSCDETTA